MTETIAEPQVERAGPAAPLLALPAVVLDLETTGLRPNQDRIVQIGAIGIRHGQVDETDVFDRLVAPGIPIPTAAQTVHGLRDVDVADAPPYPKVHPELEGFLANRLLIGYSVDFDLAMLHAEADRNQLTFSEPPYLDVMALAAGLSPQRRQIALEDLAKRYDVKPAGRHTAIGDARMTAEVYVRMLDELREAGIRTLAEAHSLQRQIATETATSTVTEWQRVRQVNARPPATVAARVARSSVDTFVYRTRLRDLMQSPVIGIGPTASLQQAAARMHELRIGSLLVETTPEAGFITQSDLTRALAEVGPAAATTPVADFATRCVVSMPEDTHLFRAIGRMSRRGFRHLAVAGEDGTIVGMVSLKGILRDRSLATLALGDQIETATNETELAAAQAHLPRTAAGLLADRLDAREVAEIISLEGMAMTQRAAELAEHRMVENGRGPAPARYCVLVLGSGGRSESLLAPDQDNALIIDDAYTGQLDAADDWFTVFADHMNNILHVAGIPLCKGKVMARERAWRRTASEWATQVQAWVRTAEPENLLNVDIFFDAAPAHGEFELANQVFDNAFRAAGDALEFVRAMGERASSYSAPLGFMGRFRTNNHGRLDLKGGGLLPVVSGARAMALRYDIRARATGTRLRQAFAAAGSGHRDAAALAETHGFLLRLILEQQLADIEAGVPPSNAVALRQLDSDDREALRAAFRRLELLGNVLRTALGGLRRPQ